MTDADNFSAVLAEQRAARREAARLFCSAIAHADRAALAATVQTMDQVGGWSTAIRRAGKLRDLSGKGRRMFREFWLQSGDDIRDSVAGDLELANVLRACLPRYTGRSKRLFRGESANNRRNRTYGLSWSASRSVAAAFLEARAPMYFGGTVLLVAQVPAEAIIASVPSASDLYAEREFLVDRRGLTGTRVEVICRLPNLREI